MRTQVVRFLLSTAMIATGTGIDAPLVGQPNGRDVVVSTGSALTAQEAEALVEYHNRARKKVGVPPVRWSTKVAQTAQQWTNEVARTGEISHRPPAGEGEPQYGENMAWGFGRDYGVLSAAEHWYGEIKYYEPGTPIPDNFADFKGLHYTQMMWRTTTEIGAGQAVIQRGEMQGWIIIVCNYHPAGNVTGQRPY
jgi:pathogenesis-related protein 1